MENLRIVRRVVLGSNMDGGKRKAHSVALSGTLDIKIPHHIEKQLQKRMEMPDSVHSASAITAAKSTWDSLHSSLPVSYRVAIAVDALVLFIAFTALVLLGLYFRKQIKRHRRPGEAEDLEMKFSGESQGENISNDGTVLGSDGSGKRGGLLGKFRRKKGHVRWTSTVETCGEGDEKGGEREWVKMKMGNEEWETDTWGPRSGKRDAVCDREDKCSDLGLRGGGGAGVRLNPFGRSKKIGIGGNGEWKRGSLWKGVEAGRDKERAARSKERIAAGYDGYRGN